MPAHFSNHYRPRVEALEDRCVPSTVTNLGDFVAGSLRDAIARTPANGTINFLPGLHGTISLETTLVIDHNLTITGAQTGGIKVSGRNLYRDFIITPGATAAIDSLTIANGLATTYQIFPPDPKVVSGGGILNEGVLILSNSTVTGNLVEYPGHVPYPSGGGIFNAGTLRVVNCTITGNRVIGNLGATGGGIANSGALTVLDSTIALNSAFSYGPLGVDGGGIFSLGYTYLANTIVARNLCYQGPDIFGKVTVAMHNLIGVGAGSNLVNGSNGNLVGTAAHPLDPLLGPLQNNGGPTPTLALLPGSPAIDAGTPIAALPTDQRGSGYRRIVDGTIDIGAFEVQSTWVLSRRWH